MFKPTHTTLTRHLMAVIDCTVLYLSVVNTQYITLSTNQYSLCYYNIHLNQKAYTNILNTYILCESVCFAPAAGLVLRSVRRPGIYSVQSISPTMYSCNQFTGCPLHRKAMCTKWIHQSMIMFNRLVIFVQSYLYTFCTLQYYFFYTLRT